MEQLYFQDGVEYFTLGSDISECPNEFESFFKIWHSKKNGPLFPCWKNFDFYDFKGWHGRVVLSETSLDPFSTTYHLYGSLVAEYLGEDLTGKTDQLGADNGFHNDSDIPYMTHLIENQKIGYNYGELSRIGMPYRRVSFIDFPMNKAAQSEKLERPTTFLTACYVWT